MKRKEEIIIKDFKVLVVEIIKDKPKQTHQDWKRNVWGSKESEGISKVTKKEFWEEKEILDINIGEEGKRNRQRYDKQ